MAKKYYWEIEEDELDEETDEPTGNKITHKISLECSNFTGKAIITINGFSFNISEKPLSLAGTEQLFRLGRMPAIISFPKSGSPVIKLDDEIIQPK